MKEEDAMIRLRRRCLIAGLVFLCGGGSSVRGEVGDVPSEEVKLPPGRGKKGAPERSYFFIGPKKDVKPPEGGYGLLLVLPGGDGGRGFHPFVKNIYKRALGNDWVAAQLIAIQWAKSKDTVWPTERTPGRGLVSSTEVFIEDVITHVARRVKLDPARIYALGWSSSGPALYLYSLQRSKSVTGFFIAMAVFWRTGLPSLGEARGESYYLLHSPEDKVCAFSTAQEAEKWLGKAGAKVKLVTYDGEHGWPRDAFERIRDGVQWLDENHAAPDRRMWPAARSRSTKGTRGK